MSNMIKAYSVRCEDGILKTIDSHLRVDKELEKKRNLIVFKEKANNEFVEGLTAVLIEQLPSEEELKEKSSKLITEAKKEAAHILEQAKQEAEKEKKDMIAAAQKKGYEDGMQQSVLQTQKLKMDYEEKEKQLQKQYEAMAEELEPKMTEILSSLIEKITGILVEDKEEVILHLAHKALNNLDKSKEYTIKVSKDNYDLVSARRSSLLGAIGRDVPLYITEDSNLKRNQCLIETDSHIINCSLDVQLSKLITDLKLLGGI